MFGPVACVLMDTLCANSLQGSRLQNYNTTTFVRENKITQEVKRLPCAPIAADLKDSTQRRCACMLTEKCHFSQRLCYLSRTVS